MSRFARVSLLVTLLATALLATPRAAHAVGADGTPLIVTNSTPITIVDVGGAVTPLPSTISVPAQSGRVLGVAVRLNQLSHTWVSDLDILLVAPDGTRAI